MTILPKTQFYRKLLLSISVIVVFVWASFAFYSKQELIFATLKPKNIYYLFHAYTSAFSAGELFGSTTHATSNAIAIPIIMYHSVLDKADGTNVTLKDFTEQMLAMHKAGYRTVSVEDVYAFLHGTKQLPDKSFLLTFDDGRKNSYYPADPLLKALGYKAVMFVIMNRVHESDPYHLSINELKQMRDTGRWELQSHGKADHDLYNISSQSDKGYFMSNKLWLKAQNRLETTEEFTARIANDMAVAKSDLMSKFGIQSLSYAFPFGDYGQNSINFRDNAQTIVLPLVHAVYPLALYQVPVGVGPLFNYPSANTFLLKRIDVTVSNWSASDLMRVLESGSPKTLPYTSLNFDIPGWTRNWGDMTFVDDTITLNATETETGSFAFFDGSIGWTNYQYTAHVHLTKGSSVGLVARYQDNNNYVDCSFNPNLVHIDQNEKGDRRVIQGTTYGGLPNGEADIGIRVHDRIVECVMNGKALVSTPFLTPSLNSGGIALKTWDAAIDNSQASFRNIRVQEIAQ